MASAALTHGDAAAARNAARAILDEGRFHSPALPRPLHGVLRAIGEGLSAPVRLAERLIGHLGRALPGGVASAWVLVALVLVAVGTVVALRYTRLAASPALQATGSDPSGSAIGAKALDRAAAQAELDGQLELAVRLRFRAGLARLRERGAIADSGATQTSELARELRSPGFDLLARRFGEIAYGEAPATPLDLEEARRRWPEVLEGAERR